MNRIPVAGLVLALALAGCGRKQAPAPQADAEPQADPNAVALGKPNTTGPYTVTLSTAQSPVKVGSVPFTAEVEQDGAPVKDADVKLTLSMPKMGMPGPSGPLTWNGKEYAGKVEAGMAGEWQADVTVNAGSDSASAAWTFNVQEAG